MKSMYLPKPALRHSLDQAILWEGKEASSFGIYNWRQKFHYFLGKAYGKYGSSSALFLFCSGQSSLSFYSSINWVRCYEEVTADAKITFYVFMLAVISISAQNVQRWKTGFLLFCCE